VAKYRAAAAGGGVVGRILAIPPALKSRFGCERSGNAQAGRLPYVLDQLTNDRNVAGISEIQIHRLIIDTPKAPSRVDSRDFARASASDEFIECGFHSRPQCLA